MESLRRFSLVDRVLGGACRALATLSDAVPARRPVPGASTGSQAADEIELTEPERRLSGALMRVNHVGEICAQALYEGQAASTSDPALREYFLGAAREEADHLAWTRSRLDELGASPSLLNPVWFAGSLAMGLVAGRVGDRWSLGFMAETERQVEAHLGSHLNRLPAKANARPAKRTIGRLLAVPEDAEERGDDMKRSTSVASVASCNTGSSGANGGNGGGPTLRP